MKLRLSCLAIILSCLNASAVVVEQVVSREHPVFETTGRTMGIGRDGYIYLGHYRGYMMRFNPDGTGKWGEKISYAVQCMTSNKDGIIATTHTHMSHSLRLWTPLLKPISVASDFPTQGDTMFSPSDVQAGDSGDFYTADPNRNRILRVSPLGKTVATFSLDETGEKFTNRAIRFRVNESLQRFYVCNENGVVHALAFDGKKLWSVTTGATWEWWYNRGGDFDADDEGNVYGLPEQSDTIAVFGPDGQPKPPIQLKSDKAKGARLTLRFWKDAIFLKRQHDTEMFQVYDRKTGELRRVISADVVRLQVEFPSEVWTAGQPVPVTISLQEGEQTTHPTWPVQISRYNDPDWMTLPLVDGKITPPADASGLYRMRVDGGECRADTVVEIRVPGSKGTVNILTPSNRLYYGRGEEIPVTVIVRGPPPDKLKLELRTGESVVWGTNFSLPAAGFVLPTAAVRPGKYLLTADAPGYTVAPQPLVIGPGMEARSPFKITEYFNGMGQQCSGTWKDLPDTVAAHIRRSRKLGQNHFVDYNTLQDRPSPEPIIERLQKDPLGVAPEKAAMEDAEQQSLAAYGAYGKERMRLLVWVDSLVPFGNPSEHAANMEKFKKSIKDTSSSLASYPAFRGWSWWEHLWMMRDNVLNETQKADWIKLRGDILQTGKWDPALEPLSDLWVSLMPDTEKAFDAALQEVAPGKKSAMSGPYRQPAIIPPVTFRNADEIDLHFQSEQIPPAQWMAHGVDFYKRPGKPAWGHLEVLNEDGTGGMLGNVLLQQVMRGADGTGWNAKMPMLRGGIVRYGVGQGVTDPRIMGLGAPSVTRALTTMLRQYGPWLTTLEASDPLAIVVSTRMLRLDDWGHGIGGGGAYFTRLLEAYNACLYAHRPASFVFTEEVQPETLQKFKAVLLVNQQVELDPPLATALSAAQTAGAAIYYDDTCRPEHVSSFKPLHVSFDAIAKEPDGYGWCDDSLYYRAARIFKQQAAKLAEALGPVMPPIAKLANPEIMLSERRNGEGRFLWAVNNDVFDWDPAMMWRVTMFVSNRLPQIAPLQFSPQGQVVYDMFAMKELKDNPAADLRLMPARLFAVLPKPIKSLTLKAPANLRAGESLAWEVSIDGPNMTYPLRLRLLDANGVVVADLNPTKTKDSLVLPLNVGAAVTLEATELISGKKSEKKIQVVSAPVQKEDVVWGLEKEVIRPVENLFGPHLRDVAVSADGTTALINAMNWDDNFYTLDTGSGKVRGQGSVGHYFAWGPVTAGKTFFVQGYDVNSPEGFHLYKLGADGKAERRFAMYGIPHDAKDWVGHSYNERLNNYTVSPKGSWVASAGNLGLIVWSAEGKKLWSQDWWKDPGQRAPVFGQDEEGMDYMIGPARQSAVLVAPNDETLITLENNLIVTAYRATTGKQLWQLKFPGTGVIRGASASADGKTLAVFSNVNGGQVVVVREGKIAATLLLPPDHVRVTPDGRFMAIFTRNELRWYSTDGTFLWSFRGDDTSVQPSGSPHFYFDAPLYEPKMAPDGKRIVFGSCTGMLWVLDDQGRKIVERDMGAIPVANWLPNHELLVATWMGDVVRLDAAGAEKWRVRLAAKGPVREKIIADATPTVRATWGNATATPDPLRPNLLNDVPVQIQAASDRPPYAAFAALQNPVELLYDGQTTVPRRPWLTWSFVQGWGKWALTFDFGKTNVHLTGVTIVEDPAHPESWIKDVLLQYWNPVKEEWLDGSYLLSNQATHTHHFDKPIEASRFRLLVRDSRGWPVGNLRFGEIVFHGRSM